MAHLVLMATADSVRDDAGTPPGAHPWETYPQQNRQPPAYGQIFRVRRARGPEVGAYAGHARVVLIWWRVGASCHWSFSSPAIRPGVSELFLGVRASATVEGSIQSGHLRPRDHWIDGIPTIDVAPNAWMYAATTAERPVNVWRDTNNMSVAEFGAFIEHVPPSSEGPASRRLMEWAIADRTRWRLYPAVDYLCHAWRNHGWAPSDSVLAASFLRAGTSRCGERRSP